jgi:hypothetical protein
LVLLQDEIQDVPYDFDELDKWIPTWGNNYSSHKFYAHVFEVIPAHPIFKTIWKSHCIPRIKFFTWLVLVDRLNTKIMLTRRHIYVHTDEACAMCN